MIKKIKQLAATLSVAVSLMVPTLAVGVVGAQGIQAGFCEGANQAATGVSGDSTCATEDQAGLESIANTVVDIFSWIVGVISVLMIVYGGFRYITSGGDSSKITNAKNTIIYAVIGLLIVAAAQFIVNFVFTQATPITT